MNRVIRSSSDSFHPRRVVTIFSGEPIQVSEVRKSRVELPIGSEFEMGVVASCVPSGDRWRPWLVTIKTTRRKAVTRNSYAECVEAMEAR